MTNYDKQQVDEQKETNFVLWVNTIFTILSGVGSIIIAWLALHK